MSVFSFSFAPTSVSGEVDFFEIETPAGVTGLLIEAHVGQRNVAGSAADEMLSYRFVRGIGSSTGNGAAAIVGKNQENSQASPFTAKVLSSVKMSGGTRTFHQHGTFHLVAGLEYSPLPKAGLFLPPGSRTTLELTKAPTTALEMTGTIYVESLG